MGYSKEAYNHALDRIEQLHQAALDRADVRRLQIYATLPELEQLDKRMSLNGIAAIKAAAKFKGSKGVAEHQAEHEKLDKERSALLQKNGISEAEFEPHFSCAVCQDSGYINGRLCECAIKLARTFEFERMSSRMPIKQCTFDSFELRYYKGAAHDLMTSVLSRCKRFAEQFESDMSGMIFMGKTGVGKTHLSLAIANEVLKKGYGVIYVTAQEFLSKLEKEHFGKADGDTEQMLCECDLLIIDDLGAEFQTQFTVSAVYNLLNSRIMEGKPTIISTNLSPAELAQTYGDRVSSRIIGNFDPLKFEGNDVRQIKMMEKLSSNHS